VKQLLEKLKMELVLDTLKFDFKTSPGLIFFVLILVLIYVLLLSINICISASIGTIFCWYYWEMNFNELEGSLLIHIRVPGPLHEKGSFNEWGPG
jgi:hypothetical protein